MFLKELPASHISAGDIVKLSCSVLDVDKDPSGVVYKINDRMLSIAFKEPIPSGWTEKIKVFKLFNETAFKRVFGAMKAFQTNPPSLLSFYLDKQTQSQKFKLEDSIKRIFYNESLNGVQKEVVEYALNENEIALIHGPPGTGKTTTIIEIVRQLCKPLYGPFKRSSKPLKILICGPSNLSVDNILEKLISFNLKMVRIGHPVKVIDTCLKYCLDNCIKTSDSGRLAQDVQREINTLVEELQKKISSSDRKSKYSELKLLRNELKLRNRELADTVINECQIVLSTLNSCASKYLHSKTFDVVIIDEVTQALEAECWLAVSKATKVIMAGDPKQLPPTVLSKKAKELEITLFDRLKPIYPSRLLTIQYRMNSQIMDWSSQEMYEGKLIAHETVKSRLLCDLEPVRQTDETIIPLLFIDTQGSGTIESASDDEDSKFNEGESELVVKYFKSLIEAGVSSKDIAIITPYNAQVSLLRSKLKTDFEDLEIGSVDGFQGREKECVIISFVRSNDEKQIGFLKESRRTNVAITRAKRHCCLIGDSDTLESDPFFKRLVNFLYSRSII